MKELKKQKISLRRMLVVLPLLVIPLLAFVFHSLSGGKGEPEKERMAKGINTALPDAQFDRKDPVDKMGYYDQAGQENSDTASMGLQLDAGNLGFSGKDNLQTRQIDEKLAAIQKEISSPQVAVKSSNSAGVGTRMDATPMSKDVDRLEVLMKGMKGAGEADPEMTQLSAMMDKIMQIQNPGLVNQELEKKKAIVPDSLFSAIPAVIAGNQKAGQGSVVELRLLDSALLGGRMIPKGHLLYGLASFSNQRMNLEIKNVRVGNQLIPVNLTVYDKRDAMVGVYAPEALLAEAAADGGTGALGTIGISGFDLPTQLAGAGLDAAKSLLSKKIRRIRQPLKAGYALLLRDNTKKPRP